MKDKLTPFGCGTQIMDWKLNNCDKCKKGYHETNQKWQCELEHGMDKAYMGDGRYAPELAAAIGYDEKSLVYVWRCPSFEAEEQ